MTAEETSHGPAKLVNPVGQTKSHQKWGARAGNAKTRRHPECRAACERPGHDGCYIVGSTPEIEIVGSSKAAVHLGTRLKVLGAEVAWDAITGERQRPADAHGIAKFEGCVAEVLFRNEVFGDCPPFEGTAQDQPGFDLMLLLAVGNLIRLDENVFVIMANHLQQCLVGGINVFVFDV